MRNERTFQPHIEGFEWLRAVMSIAVVAWHMSIIPNSSGISSEDLAVFSFSLSEFVNFHFFLTAVPVFLAISCFLFARNQQTPYRLRSSFSRVFLLLLFWPAALKLWRGSVAQLIYEIPLQPLELIAYLNSGGYTIFYFFVSLLLCYAICYLVSFLRTRWVLCAFALSIAALWGLSVTAQVSGIRLTTHDNPMNFIPYALGSVVVARFESDEFFVRNRNYIALIFMVIAIPLAVAEWNWMIDPVHFMALPSYTRPSLVFIAYGLLLIGLDPRIRTNSVVRYLSTTSLSLYCLHPFFISFGEAAVRKSYVLQSIPFSALLIVILLSNIAFHIGKLFLKRELLWVVHPKR